MIVAVYRIPALFDGEVDAVVPNRFIVVFDGSDVASNEFGNVHFAQLANMTQGSVALNLEERNSNIISLS